MKLRDGHHWLLFAGSAYYPLGGVDDYFGCYKTKAGAIRAMRRFRNIIECGVSDWADVVDTTTGDVYSYSRRDGEDGGKWVEELLIDLEDN